MKIPNPFKKEYSGYPIHTTREQRMKLEKRKIMLRKAWKVFKIVWFVLGTIAILSVIQSFFSTHEFRSPIIERVETTPTPTAILSPTPMTTPIETPIPTIYRKTIPSPTKLPVQGKVSHYSTEGCLGCSASLTMGNGQTLDDTAYTIAVQCEAIRSGEVSYNTKVRITNIDNGKSVVGTITDCGGFSKYNRIADLTLAVAGALGTKTDVSNVLIEKI